jgi:hypothetical protein
VTVEAIANAVAALTPDRDRRRRSGAWGSCQSNDQVRTRSALASAAVQLDLGHQPVGVLPRLGGDVAKRGLRRGERTPLPAALPRKVGARQCGCVVNTRRHRCESRPVELDIDLGPLGYGRRGCA